MEKDTTPFFTTLAIDHPITMLIQQLITKISSNKNVNNTNKISKLSIVIQEPLQTFIFVNITSNSETF